MKWTYQERKALDDKLEEVDCFMANVAYKREIDYASIEDLKKKAARAEDECQRSAKRCGELTDDIRLLQERVDGLSYHVEKLRNSSPKPSASSYNVGSLSTPDSITGSIIPRLAEMLDSERYKAALEEILKDAMNDAGGAGYRITAERALGIKSDLEDNGK